MPQAYLSNMICLCFLGNPGICKASLLVMHTEMLYSIEYISKIENRENLKLTLIPSIDTTWFWANILIYFICAISVTNN